MRIAKKLEQLIANLAWRQGREDALSAELRAYADEMAERNVLKGMNRGETQRQALLEIGGIEQIKEKVREEWLGQTVQTTLQDMRYACRSLLRCPAFTAVVLVTLAPGIATNLTMFGLVRAVLCRPVPYPEPNRIVTIEVDARSVPNTGATSGEVLDLKERGHSFEQASTISAVDAYLEYQGEKEHVQAASVSDSFLPLLGAHPALVRTLDSRIDVGKLWVSPIMISDDLWRRRFAADPEVIGKAVLVNNIEVRIVGVLPRGFRLFSAAGRESFGEDRCMVPGALEPGAQVSRYSHCRETQARGLSGPSERRTRNAGSALRARVSRLLFRRRRLAIIAVGSRTWREAPLASSFAARRHNV